MRPKCPTCGMDGDSYVGTSRGAVYHYLERALWVLHQLRHAAEKDGQGELPKFLSGVIRDLEDLVRRMFDDGRH